MSTKRLLCTILVVLAATSSAGAHNDSNADPSRCDSWSRGGHSGGHHHSSSSDVSVGDPLHTQVHGQSGHYVIRNDAGYIEVVGGQSYRGPDPSGNEFPGQGGYVQGEIDVAPGAPDADWNVAAFGPNADELPPADAGAVVVWIVASYGRGCMNVAGVQQAAQTRAP